MDEDTHHIDDLEDIDDLGNLDAPQEEEEPLTWGEHVPQDPDDLPAEPEEEG